MCVYVCVCVCVCGVCVIRCALCINLLQVLIAAPKGAGVQKRGGFRGRGGESNLVSDPMTAILYTGRGGRGGGFTPRGGRGRGGFRGGGGGRGFRGGGGGRGWSHTDKILQGLIILFYSGFRGGRGRY